MVSILNVDLDEWNNFVIHDFSSLDHLGFRKPVRGYELFQNDPFDDFKFNNFEYKVVRDHHDLHLIHYPLFHLDNF